MIGTGNRGNLQQSSGSVVGDCGHLGACIFAFAHHPPPLDP